MKRRRIPNAKAKDKTKSEESSAEQGYKWWLRYVIVPLIGGGGLVAIIVALLTRPPSTSTGNPGLYDDIDTPPPSINALPTNVSGKITFFRGNNYFLMDSDGSNEKLIAQIGWSVFCPRISPDGQKVAFISWSGGKPDIYTLNSDGTNLRNISRTRYQDELCASWSPDGSKLLYGREYSVGNDIFVMNSNGSDQENLTDIVRHGITSANTFTESPWSPDGTRFVFSSNRDGKFHIYMMNTDGTKLEQLTNDSSSDEYHPVWAPDGDRIAFVSTASVDDSTNILVLDLRVNPPVLTNMTNHPSHNSDPAWSPDGTKILFVSDRDGNRDIFVMNSNGTNIKKITDTPDEEENPHWLS